MQRIVGKLVGRVDMLDEYFSMKINEKGELESLPLLLRDYTPNLDKLPLFLMRLGPQVSDPSPPFILAHTYTFSDRSGELDVRRRMLQHFPAGARLFL